MLKAVVTAALLFAALGARAEMVPQMLGTDPLSREILTKTTQVNGGVTAAVRVGTGVVELKLTDVSASPFPAQMAPAALTPAIALKPAEGLAPKVSKVKAKKFPRRAVDQLKHVFKAVKNWR